MNKYIDYLQITIIVTVKSSLNLMNIQANAVFLGGVSALTSAETLSEYFSRFGQIVDVVLSVNKKT
jgi:RNA recognition motif-containing protein